MKTVHFATFEHVPNEDGTFDVIKHVRYNEYYNKPEDHVLFKSVPDEIKADILVNMCRFLKVEKKVEVKTWEDIKGSLATVSVDTLRFRYCCETIGSGWALHSAYKLMNPYMIKLWLSKCACHNGISFDLFDTGIKSQEVVDALADAIKSCLNMYYPLWLNVN